MIEVVTTAEASDLRLIEAIRALVPISMRMTGEPGISLALGRRGKLIWKAAFGWADLASGAAMTPDHVFKLGSMSKPYVATAVMQLVEQGRLKLDEQADIHLPFKVENPLGERPVTIRDLLIHQSGLSLGDGGESQVETPRPLAVALEEGYARPFQRANEGTRTPTWTAKVGEAWQYSNLGTATLGLIVERTNPDGLSVADYVARRIMAPLGMTQAQFPAAQDADHLRPEMLARLAPGYARFGQVYLPTPTVQIEAYPAGVAVAAPADHLRFLMATLRGGELDGQRILQAESVAQMLTRQRDTPAPNMDQGLLWRVMDRGQPSEQFEHSGAYMFGYVNAGAAWPKLDAAVVVSSTMWPLPSGAVTRDLLQAFIGDWLLQEARMGAGPPAVDDARAASYVTGLALVDALQGRLGMTTRLTPDEARDLASRACFLPGAPAADVAWDAQAFVEGIEALRGTTITQAELTAFRDSGRMTVSPQEVRRLYRALGALADDFALAAPS
jgi:CubicO group peptidase (beta-lactamase class C family)